jgi:hypothetical protein
MTKRSYLWLVVPVMCVALLLGLMLLRPNRVNAEPAQQYPILDKVAAKVIAKYQKSSCEQLWQQKSYDQDMFGSRILNVPFRAFVVETRCY